MQAILWVLAVILMVSIFLLLFFRNDDTLKSINFCFICFELLLFCCAWSSIADDREKMINFQTRKMYYQYEYVPKNSYEESIAYNEIYELNNWLVKAKKNPDYYLYPNIDDINFIVVDWDEKEEEK